MSEPQHESAQPEPHQGEADPSESHQPGGTDRHSLVEAFVNEVREPGSRTRMGPRALAVSAAVVVVGAAAVGFGMTSGNGNHGAKPAAAGQPTPSPSAPGAAAPTPAPTTAGAPGQPPVQAPVGQSGDGAAGGGAPAAGAGGTGGAPGGAPAPGTGGQPAGTPAGQPAPPAGAAPGSNPAPPQTNNAAVKPAGFNVVSGYGCGSSAAESFSEHGQYSSGTTGWIAVGKGGWASDGCNGSFDAMPMSGSASSADSHIYAVWSFSPGTAGLTKASCQVQLYVPNDHDQTHVGGDPAHFQVYSSADASGSATSDFNVDQFGYLGQWKPVGTFAVTKGTLSIKLDNRGLDWHNSTVTNAHLAVAQFRASCA